MNQIFAVKYTDALYFKKSELKSEKPRVHVAVGKIIEKENYLIVCFSEKIDGTPLRGLILPKGSLILGQTIIENGKKSLAYPQKGADMGIYWSDITYFENSKIPSGPTNMYTEGKLIKEGVHSITIGQPKTIKIKGALSENHPDNIEPESCIIPKSLINDIEIYGNK